MSKIFVIVLAFYLRCEIDLLALCALSTTRRIPLPPTQPESFFRVLGTQLPFPLFATPNDAEAVFFFLDRMYRLPVPDGSFRFFLWSHSTRFGLPLNVMEFSVLRFLSFVRAVF